MTEQEIRGWEREIRHAEMMKKNSKGWGLKAAKFNSVSVIPFGDTYEVKDNDNESNR